MLNKKKLEEYSFKLTSVLMEVFENEDNEYHIDLEQVQESDCIDEFLLALSSTTPFYIVKHISNIKTIEHWQETIRDLEIVLKRQKLKEIRNQK